MFGQSVMGWSAPRDFVLESRVSIEHVFEVSVKMTAVPG